MGVVQPNVQPQQKCYVLGYNQGYANLSSVHYLAVKNTANKGACCNLCLRDNRCVAWTRVAGDCPPLPPFLAHYMQAATLHTVHGAKIYFPHVQAVSILGLYHLPMQSIMIFGVLARQLSACTTRDQMCMR